MNWIVRNEKQNKSYAYDHEVKNSKKAILRYKMIGSSDHYSLLEVNLLTGRHHQIRCQLAKMGCPITRTPAKERDTRGKRALKMAQCYQRINATPKSIAAYRNAIRYNQASKEDQLAYARQLLKNGDYRQAEKVFLMLKDSMPGNQLVANGLKSAQMAPEWKKQGSRPSLSLL